MYIAISIRRGTQIDFESTTVHTVSFFSLSSSWLSLSCFAPLPYTSATCTSPAISWLRYAIEFRGVALAYRRSICSSARPFVYRFKIQKNLLAIACIKRKKWRTSGIQKYVKMRHPKQVVPQMKNTFAPRSALFGPGSTRYGAARDGVGDCERAGEPERGTY